MNNSNDFQVESLELIELLPPDLTALTRLMVECSLVTITKTITRNYYQKLFLETIVRNYHQKLFAEELPIPILVLKFSVDFTLRAALLAFGRTISNHFNVKRRVRSFTG